MKKGMFSKLFILLLVVGLLFAVAPTQQVKAETATVNSETALREALDNTGVDVIELSGGFNLTATVNVNRPVTIDGKNNTIVGPSKGTEAWEGHGIQVLANDVTIKNLNITGSGRSNLQFYVATGGVVEYVNLSNAANAGMIVNGSTVTITNVTTYQNAWGGINVDQGSGVTATPLLTVSNVTTHTSPTTGTKPAIWVDKGIADWVSAGGLYSVVSDPGGFLVFYDKTEFAAIAANFPIHNTTKDIRYVSIQAAITAASTGDTIQVPAGTFTENLLLTKPITLQGEGVTTIIEGDILYQSDTLITGTMTLKNLQVNDSASAFRMGLANVGVFDAVVIDGVTMGSNLDGTARAISFDADGDGYTLNGLTVKNSTIHSTLAIYLTGKVGAINIDNNDFYITGKHWNGYNAININQYKPASDPSVPAGAYTINNNRFHHPEATTTNGHVGMITNQAVGDLIGIGGGKELIYSGNQLTVGTDVINDQSEFVNDAIAKTNAMTIWIVETGKRFGTIQAAINAAITDNTIMVAAGTYIEDLVINKALTLKGAGIGQTIVQGVTGGAGDVVVSASNVTIKDFTLKAFGQKFIIINQSTDSFKLIDNEIITGANTGLDNGWVGIETYSGTQQTNHVITGNSIVANRTAQLVYYNSDSQAGMTFTNNTITGTLRSGGVGVVFESLSGDFDISDNSFAESLIGASGFMGTPGLTPDQMNALFLGNT